MENTDAKMSEKKLETKYLPVLAYVEAGKLLADYRLTAGKIRGAITSFCRVAQYERPQLFTEMENDFTPDFMDWWLDNSPEIHKYLDEADTREAVNKYLAYVDVWKAKFKNNEIMTPHYVIQASTMLTVKNALSAAVTAWLSYNKRIDKLKQSDIVKVFPEMFQSLLPTIHGLQTGLIQQPTGTRIEDVSRLIGAYYAGNKTLIDMAESLKQIEYQQPQHQEAA